MNDLPKAALVGIFIEMAKDAKPNTLAAEAAQSFFKDRLMAPLIPAGDKTPETRENAFWEAATAVAKGLSGGASYQVPETHSALMGRIKDASPQVHHAVRKSCLGCAIEAPGWN